MEWLIAGVILWIIVQLDTYIGKSKNNSNGDRLYPTPNETSSSPLIEDTPTWKTYIGDYKYLPADLKLEYLQSTEWKNLKSIRMFVAGGKCETCGSTHNLQLHHQTYERLTRETIEDVRILCGGPSGCHQKIHNKYGYDRGTYYPIEKMPEL